MNLIPGRMDSLLHFDPPLHGDGLPGQAGVLLELHVALHELVHGDLAVAVHVQRSKANFDF